MIDFEQIIYNRLKTTSLFELTYSRPQTITSFPFVGYVIEENNVEFDLDKEISNYMVKAKIDIFTEDLAQMNSIIDYIAENLKQDNFILQKVIDAPDPDGYLHKVLEFIY